MNRFLFTILVLSQVVFNHTLLCSQQDRKFDSVWKNTEKYYKENLQKIGIVGSNMMFIHDGEVLRSSYYGLADLETKRPVDEKTIYHWASNTKMFTGIAIMQLRDRGLISLDDPIIKYIPALKVVHNPFGDMNDITIRHLMSHSAGFRMATWPWKDHEKAWQPHEPTHWEQLVAMLPYTEIIFEPDSQYSYSNPGIIFLGRIIELLSGDDYEVYIDKNIFKPLEMYNSYFDHTPYHLLKYRSNNYFIMDGDMTANGLDFDTGITVSNGGLNAPFGDIAKYVSFLMGSKAKQSIFDRVLSRSSLEEMWGVQHPVDSDSTLQTSMGLIFFLLKTDAVQVVGHTGGQKAFTTFIYVQPQSRTGCVAAFNTSIWRKDIKGELYSPSRDLFNGLRLKFLDDVIPLFIQDKQ